MRELKPGEILVKKNGRHRIIHSSRLRSFITLGGWEEADYDVEIKKITPPPVDPPEKKEETEFSLPARVTKKVKKSYLDAIEDSAITRPQLIALAVYYKIDDPDEMPVPELTKLVSEQLKSDVGISEEE